MPYQHKTLMCRVISLNYDFDAKSGRLVVAPGDNCNMTGCTDLFLAIDPRVRVIETFSGDKRDTTYRRLGRSTIWGAYLPSEIGGCPPALKDRSAPLA